MTVQSFFARGGSQFSSADEVRSYLADFALTGIILMAYAAGAHVSALKNENEAIKDTPQGVAYRARAISQEEVQLLRMLNAWAEARKDRNLISQAQILLRIELRTAGLDAKTGADYMALCGESEKAFDFSVRGGFQSDAIENLMLPCCYAAWEAQKSDRERQAAASGGESPPEVPPPSLLDCKAVRRILTEDSATDGDMKTTNLLFSDEFGLNAIHPDNLAALAKAIRTDLFEERQCLADLQMIVLVKTIEAEQLELMKQAGKRSSGDAMTTLDGLAKSLKLLAEVREDVINALPSNLNASQPRK